MVTVENLRELHYREPFEPFQIVLKDAREFIVSERTHYAISPTGKTIAYAPLIDDFEIIDIADIAALRQIATAGAR
jgi:hypothetical protein